MLWAGPPSAGRGWGEAEQNRPQGEDFLSLSHPDSPRAVQRELAFPLAEFAQKESCRLLCIYSEWGREGVPISRGL